MIRILLAIEDLISYYLAQNILDNTFHNYYISNVIGYHGNSYLKQKAIALNKTANSVPVFILTDLDEYTCPINLINQWIPHSLNENLIFRVAVREVESWLLTNKEHLSIYLSINERLFPDNPDSLKDPKLTLINLARRSRKKEIREGIVPPSGSTSSKGPEYNALIAKFINNKWNAHVAYQRSPSFAKAYDKLKNFSLNATNS